MGSSCCQGNERKYKPSIDNPNSWNQEGNKQPVAFQIGSNDIKIQANQVMPNFGYEKQGFHKIAQQFHVYEYVRKLMGNVAFTSDSAASIGQSIIDTIVRIQDTEAKEEKQIVIQFFTAPNIKLMHQGKLLYNNIVKKLSEKNLNGTLKQFTLSRVYHMIANTRKQKEQNDRYVNSYDIICQKNLAYQKLSDEDIEVVIKYEHISSHIEKLGKKLKFNLYSINKQSQNVIKLFSQCLNQEVNLIKSLKYNLQIAQAMTLAKLSKQSCRFYDNGIYVLLVYFVKSSQKLQKEGVPLKKIEEKLKYAIECIGKEYPPGSGLKKEEQYLKTALLELQDQKNYNKATFKHSITPLLPNNKQNQIDKIIKEKAQIALKNKQHFQELIKSTCLQRCISFKIGLKYNPNSSKQNLNKETKVLTRIKEKMFFPKSDKYEVECKGETIEQILQSQQKKYLQEIDLRLQKMSNVVFKVNDMLRARCVFLEVSDIIETVNDIKRFIKDDKRFQLTEIQSRFSNKIPISDVTLKIVINKQIQVELQLTIQSNASVYNFAHKVYELQRTKVFSKIKIVFNYFQEMRQDFKELAKKGLNLINKDSKIVRPQTSQLQDFFDLKELVQPSFDLIFQSTVQSNSGKIPKLLNTLDSNLQEFMFTVFSGAFGQWNKNLGLMINSILQKDYSPKLKAAMLAFFYTQFSLPKECERMQEFTLSKQDNELKKRYIDVYFTKYFSIQQPFKYATQTYRVFHRAQQIQQIEFQGRNTLKREIVFVENLVVQQQSLEQLNTLNELLNFYFFASKGSGTFYPQFDSYYKWLINIASSNPQLDQNKLIISNSKLFKAESLLLQNKVENSMTILKEVVGVFKEKEEYLRVLECELLLVQCYCKSQEKKSLADVINIFQKQVIDFSKVAGVQLRGKIIANTQWRITDYLWQKFSGQKDRQKTLDYFYKETITQLSRSTGNTLIIAMSKMWNQLAKYNISQPIIGYNQSLESVFFNNYAQLNCQHITRPKWENLTKLDISKCNIGNQGCRLLSKGAWNKLSSLSLIQNAISAEGCEQLIKGDWINLTDLFIQFNVIGSQGASYLSESNWPNLALLSMGHCEIGSQGCKFLSQANWPNLQQINLWFNYTYSKGCKELLAANWKKMKKICLADNLLYSGACEFLSKSKWQNLQQLNLDWHNGISSEDCLFLSKANWKNLTVLKIHISRIGEEGCKYLSQADWPNLSILTLSSNQITDNGCHYLAKANWKKLKTLEISNNKFQALGCKYLMHANWPILQHLDIWASKITETGVEDFSNSVFKDSLKNLLIGKSDLGTQGMRNIYKAYPKNLREIHINQNQIGDEGCKLLASLQLANVVLLSIHTNNIGIQGMKHFSKAQLKNLKRIYLGHNRIDDNCCQLLSTMNFISLNHLNIDSCEFGSKGCQFLSKGKWINLNYLIADINKIDDEGCKYLSQSFKKLIVINLYKNKVTASGCQFLANANWKNLNQIVLTQNDILEDQRLMVKSKFTQEKLIIRWN